MTRFINTALIGLVAFVIILAGLWLVVDPAAPGLPTQEAESPTAISVRSTKVAWDPSAPGRDLEVEVVLRNQGAAGSLTQVAYRATLDGQPLAAATGNPPATLGAGLDTPVRFTIPLPGEFAARWLRATQDGDTDTLRVDGTLSVRTAAADQRLPFQWSTSAASKLLDHLSDAPQDCPGAPAPLCLKSIDAGPKPGGLQVRLDLRNDQADPLVVRNGTYRLVFEDVTVAQGSLRGIVGVEPGETAELAALLAVDEEALAQWWIGHVGRCESSRLALAVHLDVETVETGASAVDWEILAAPLQTGLLCRGSGA